MDLTDSLAIVALTVSSGLALWEVIKFRREGAWIRVTLSPGLYDDKMLRTMNMRVPEESELYGEKGLRFDIEVAIVEVENRGRTAVTIRGVSLEFQRQRWPRRRKRQSVGFPFIEFKDSSTSDRVRIEAFDSATFIIDACQALPAITGRGATADVRALVDIAGRKPARSPRRSAWHFEEGERPWLFDIGTFDLSRQIYRFLAWRVRADVGSKLALPDFAMKVAALVEGGTTPNRDELEEVVRGAADDYFPLRMATFELAAALQDSSGGLLDGTGIGRRRLARGAQVAGPDERGVNQLQ